MKRRLTMIATLFAVVAFAGTAAANHHEAGEGHGAKTEKSGATCEHGSKESCPHHAEDEACEHHAAGEPCDCHADPGSEKSESEA